jgi:hypothetical protein
MEKTLKTIKNLLVFLFLTILISMSVSCTQNQRAKNFGGTAKYDLPKGKKLLVVTWKGDDMWYLVRDAKEGETPETYQFYESSSWGLMNGKIILKEK